MKTIKVTFLEDTFGELKSALEWNDGKEKAAYLLCHSSTYRDSTKLMPHKVFSPEKKDYTARSCGFYELDRPFINKVLNEAIGIGSDFIQCHIHPGDPGTFSPIDAVDEPEFMQHIAGKIDGIYHGSLVFGNSLTTLDAWFYEREKNRLVDIERVLVVGKSKAEIHVPTRRWPRDETLSPSLCRTAMAFGEEAIKLLGRLDVGIVGVSALGGPIAELLARDRVKSILLCDPDTIEVTNLNRLRGTTPSDIGKPKVDFYAEMIQRIDPEVEAIPFKKPFYDQEVQRAFTQADVIFGCVDSGARLSINRLAMANLIPYFDLGAMVEIKDEKLRFVGGQVYSVIPGRNVCLHCSGAFSRFLAEYLSPGDTELLISQGYITGEDDIPDPSVAFLDYVIAGIGYSQFLRYVLGRDEQEIFKLYYDEILNRLVPSKCSEAGCMTCLSDGFLGKGDKVPFMLPRANTDFASLDEVQEKDEGQNISESQETSSSEECRP